MQMSPASVVGQFESPFSLPLRRLLALAQRKPSVSYTGIFRVAMSSHRTVRVDSSIQYEHTATCP